MPEPYFSLEPEDLQYTPAERAESGLESRPFAKKPRWWQRIMEQNEAVKRGELPLNPDPSVQAWSRFGRGAGNLARMLSGREED